MNAIFLFCLFLFCSRFVFMFLFLFCFFNVWTPSFFLVCFFSCLVLFPSLFFNLCFYVFVSFSLCLPLILRIGPTLSKPPTGNEEEKRKKKKFKEKNFTSISFIVANGLKIQRVMWDDFSKIWGHFPKTGEGCMGCFYLQKLGKWDGMFFQTL